MKRIMILATILSLMMSVHSSACATNIGKTKKLMELATILEIMASDYDYGEAFKDPKFEYEENTNQFIMVFERTDIDGTTGRLLSELMPETYYDSFLDMCTSGYQIIQNATKDISDDLYIVVGITGNDQEIIMYTLNGRDFTNIVVK